MNIEQITKQTCINKIRAMRSAVATEEDIRHRNCSTPCDNYKPVSQFNGERWAYLRLYEVKE